MDTNTSIDFKVTPSQKETIELRAKENGFDDILVYLKVIALKTQAFSISSPEQASPLASIELSFKVDEAELTKIQANMKECECEDMGIYMRHLGLHAVVSAVVEIRSTGNFQDMVDRITKAKERNKAN